MLPQIIPATATSSVYSPSVRITAFSGGAFSTGRISTRSTTAPEHQPGDQRDDEPEPVGAGELITPRR